MITRSARTSLGFLALALFGIGAAPSTEAAPPTSISACPYNITTSGNYVVTRDLTISGSCIGINADNVALDLQGHRITGDGAGNGYGIRCSGNGCNHVIIANGTVQSFDTGIWLIGSFNTVAQMTVQKNTGVDRGNPGNGIVLTGNANTVTNSSANGNTRTGMQGGFNCIVSGSQANNNGEEGMQFEDSTITDSEANNNGVNNPNPPPGIFMGGTFVSSVTRTTARGNARTGISIVGSVTDSDASGNGEDGILIRPPGTGGNSSVTGSTANNNGDRGIVLTCPVAAFNNIAINNPGGNIVTSDNTCVLLDNKTR
jgi:hypothetical protein